MEQGFVRHWQFFSRTGPWLNTKIHFLLPGWCFPWGRWPLPVCRSNAAHPWRILSVLHFLSLIVVHALISIYLLCGLDYSLLANLYFCSTSVGWSSTRLCSGPADLVCFYEFINHFHREKCVKPLIQSLNTLEMKRCKNITRGTKSHDMTEILDVSPQLQHHWNELFPLCHLYSIWEQGN